jgi:hypothetical protein
MYYACILCIYIYIHVSIHTYLSSFDDVYLIYSYETAGISKVPGSASRRDHEARHQRGDKERYGRLATHLGTALLQDRGGVDGDWDDYFIGVCWGKS